jgi:hypothetical protein
MKKQDAKVLERPSHRVDVRKGEEHVRIIPARRPSAAGATNRFNRAPNRRI